MKKILLLLILLAVSCSKEENPSEDNISKEDLVGTWEITSATMNGASLDINDCIQKQKLEFTTDNITYVGSYLTSSEGTVNCRQYIEVHTYTIEGKQILIPNSELGVNYRAVVKTPVVIEFTTNNGGGNALKQTFSKR